MLIPPPVDCALPSCSIAWSRLAAGQRADHALGLRAEQHHRQLVVVAQQRGDPLRALGRQRDFGAAVLFGAHAARDIDQDHDADRRQPQLGRNIHRDRQRLLDRRAPPAARAERVFAADHQQPAAKIVNIGRDRGLRAVGHGALGHIHQRQRVVGAQRAQAIRHRRRRDRADVDLRRFERVGQVGGLAGLAFDQQHARLAADEAVGLGGVVLGPRIVGCFQPHDIAVEVRLRFRQR